MAASGLGEKIYWLGKRKNCRLGLTAVKPNKVRLAFGFPQSGHARSDTQPTILLEAIVPNPDPLFRLSPT